eukprot:CAMPEP_0202725490 /NCGR_PEP_ID=MMETSP1385-20130828/182513_1 /ASSEMBLY_ACC=CAM_ASM_000861 /TAXON_ID=933848 /ORGANISM="Elphidium margaritaceum" /LENGTH=65 /DNA_ID=CAMNT_0049391591 /DNA_START=123 /DNA_END=316 /DNA_ORIENTATION=+
MDMLTFATYWNAKHENAGNWQRFFEGVEDKLICTALSKSADNWIELVSVQNDDNELSEEFKYVDT